MTRSGRKRKFGHREKNGCVQRPPDYQNAIAKENQSVVLEARKRHFELTEEQAKSALSGHVLGILNIKGVISERQMNAGNAYMEQYFRYCRLKGFPPRNPKVASYAQMIAGMSSGHIPDDETVRTAEQRLKDAQTAVIDSLGALPSIPAFAALERFAINQEHHGQCTPAYSGPLKECLNALAKHYGV